MRSNPALAKLRADGTNFGPGIAYDSADLVEQLSYLGFDWLWLDWQHGQFTESSLNNALGRFLAVETVPIVRVKSHEPGTINRVLDMGAMGIIVPMVQTAEEAALWNDILSALETHLGDTHLERWLSVVHSLLDGST